jgi:cell division protease FtsH
MTRSELMNRLAVLLGGRAAESVIFHEISTGAEDDLMKASDIARGMVARFGMDPALGQVAYEAQRQQFLQSANGTPWEPRRYSDETAAAIDAAMRSLIERAFALAVAVLEANLPLLREGAARLLSHETLSGDDLETLARSVQTPALPAPAGS